MASAGPGATAPLTTGAAMIRIQRAETPDDLDAVRTLIRGFVRWTMAEIAQTDNPAIFAGLETELAELPGALWPADGLSRPGAPGG